MKKNILAGIAVSCVCIYFALRGINLSEVAATFRADAPLRIEFEQHLPEPKRLMVSAYAVRS